METKKIINRLMLKISQVIKAIEKKFMQIQQRAVGTKGGGKMAQNENVVGGKFQIDISDLKKGLAEANRQIRLSNSEFQAAAAGMGDWTKSEEGLTAKIKQLNTNIDVQKQKVSALQKEYEAVAREKGENSKEAQNLKIRINAETKALKESESELDKTTKALNDFGKETKDAEKSTNKLTGTLKGLASGAGKAVAGIGAAAAGAVAGFFALGEATQDTIEDMGKLEAAFTTAGHSGETAQKTYTGLVGVLGETDQSVEAANHLAKLTKNEEELAKWTNIATGVYATFGDSLPIEGLTEAANETAKTGSLTGGLADALNWAGISEEEFQKQLDKCNTEQERATLITNTLNKTYIEAAENYRKVNGELILAREAQAEMTNAMSEMGRVALPITTELKFAFADLIKSIVPGLEDFGEGLIGLINGTEGAEEQVTSGIEGIVGGITEKLTGAIPIIANIANALVPALLNGIISALPSLVDGAAQITITLVNTLLQALPQLTNVAMQIIISLINVLTEALPQIVIAIIQIVPQIIDALLAAIPQLLDAAIQFLMAIVEAIPTIIQALIVALPKIITTIINAIVQAIPQLLQGAIQLLMAIIQAIPIIVQLLVQNLPQIINTILQALLKAIPQLLDAAIEFLMAIIKAIPTIIKELVKNLPLIITTITRTLIENLPLLIQAAIELLMGIVKAIPTIQMELIKSMPQIIKAITTGLIEAIPQIIKIGGDMIRGLWKGISNVGDWLREKISGFFGGVVDNIKSFFGIKSPSRKMANLIGKPMAQGVGVGFEKEMKNVKKGIVKSMDMDLGVEVPGNNNGSTANGTSKSGNVIYFTQNNNSPKALSRLEIYRQTKNALANVQGVQ